jgi:hypothetical protein
MWPFVFRKKELPKLYKPKKITKINDSNGVPYKATNWVLIEPNGNLHYGFLDANLLNFPTHNEEVWYIPTFYKEKIEMPSKNDIKLVITEYQGSINPWALLLGYEIKGPFIFNSDYPFGIVDIQMLEKLV